MPEELYVVNEVRPGGDARKPGALYVFSSAEAVERYFEPWYVDETYLLLNQDGTRRIFEVVNDRIVITASNDQADYSDKLREFLSRYLGSVERANRARKKIEDANPTDFSRLTTEELIRLARFVSDE